MLVGVNLVKRDTARGILAFANVVGHFLLGGAQIPVQQGLTDAVVLFVGVGDAFGVRPPKAAHAPDMIINIGDVLNQGGIVGNLSHLQVKTFLGEF